MSIDAKTFNAPATRGDVAGVAIDCVLALRAVQEALEALKSGQDIKSPLKSIEESIGSLNSAFDRLSGWISDS